MSNEREREREREREKERERERCKTTSACVHACVCVCGLLKVISELVVCIVCIVVIEKPRFINEFENMPEDIFICFQT